MAVVSVRCVGSFAFCHVLPLITAGIKLSASGKCLSTRRKTGRVVLFFVEVEGDGRVAQGGTEVAPLVCHFTACACVRVCVCAALAKNFL